MHASRTNSTSASDRARWLLALGALLGIALTAVGALRDRDARPGLPAGEIVARVNGVAISRESWERAVSLLARDRRTPLTPADRRHVLERLIDEELLVQRGVALGLVESDRAVRKTIVSSMLDAVVLESGQAEPEPDELRAFFEQNRGYFTPPDRLHVRRLFARTRARADGARDALRSGEAFATIQERLGDEILPPLPDGPLPFHKLADYLGPKLRMAAERLEVGGVSEPVEANGGFHVLVLVSRDVSETSYAAVEKQVVAEFRRRADERALRDYLDGLRVTGTLELAIDVPDAGG